MELHPEFIRDMHNHYMILKGNQEEQSNYTSKMLMNNSVPGILRTEIRYLDSLDLYYYDITSKKALRTVYEGKSMDYAVIKKLIVDLLHSIENSQEYLLIEHDFIITAEFIYFDQNESIGLCYLPGYSYNILEQFSYLFEYIMNKVDYKDEAAVRLIYALYKESRDIECTFYKLNEVLNHSSAASIMVCENTELNNTIKTNQKAMQREYKKENLEHYHIKSEIDKSEVVNEKEVLYFSQRSYVLAGTSIVAGIIILLVVYFSGMISNSIGSGVNSVKLIACLLIFVCVETYVMTRIFNPDKKQTKMESVLEYIKEIGQEKDRCPHLERLDCYNENTILGEREDRSLIKGDKMYKEEKTEILWNNALAEEEKTQVLTYLEKSKNYYLTPIKSNGANEKFVKIRVSEYPFYIGKASSLSNMIIDDKSISRKHGVITCMEDKISYMDLDSTNGTFINNIKLEGNKPYTLTPFDEVSFANIKYLWEELEE